MSFPEKAFPIDCKPRVKLAEGGFKSFNIGKWRKRSPGNHCALCGFVAQRMCIFAPGIKDPMQKRLRLESHGGTENTGNIKEERQRRTPESELTGLTGFTGLESSAAGRSERRQRFCDELGLFQACWKGLASSRAVRVDINICNKLSGAEYRNGRHVREILRITSHDGIGFRM